MKWVLVPDHINNKTTDVIGSHDVDIALAGSAAVQRDVVVVCVHTEPVAHLRRGLGTD